MRTRVESRNTALQNLAADVDGGFVRFYAGVQPADPNTALAGNALIAACGLSTPAAGAPSGGTISFNVIGSAIAATGTPTFARFFRADGVTAVVDMSVPEEITLTKPSWVAGETFAGPAITWSQAVE